ncbi:MAG: IS256 family transposase [Clostridiales bacterium]|jgi:putative transposase|nr:IS256 family transposase [Clostridiales bacterium]
MKTSKNILTGKEKELVSALTQDCQSTRDIQSKLKRLFAGAIEQMLECEMDEHLGYEKYSEEGNNSGNSRNGYNYKTIISDYGESEIAVPRDRNGEFEPKVLEKRQTRTDEIEQKIMAMYAKGMSQRDIEDNLREIYGADIPQTLISKITDKILPEVNEWQNRPLESIYPIVYFDGIMFKSRKDNQIVNKCVYSVLGIDMNGQKEILGIWLSENEGASFYASICSDLKKRGVTEVFIACHDNLKGLCEAVNAVFPNTKQQLCVVHQVRNSTAFVSYKDRKESCADLKKIYSAVNLDDAEYAKEEFREKREKKYPAILRSWDTNWSELTTFFEFPEQIRRLIYTTNAVEAYHRMVRKFTKAKAIFPTDDSIRKVVFLSFREVAKKWTQPVRDWAYAYSQIMSFFADRFAA